MAIEEGELLTPVEESRMRALAAIIGIAVKNTHVFEEMQVNSVSDALTGCFNRAHAFTTLDSEMRRAKRNHRPLSVVMLDIDGFKEINDEHGHLCGDQLLQTIGETLRRTLRVSDVKCRYGGDEFLLILPDTPLEGAEQVGDHVRRAIERLEVGGRNGPVPCRVSLGIAMTTANEIDATSLVARADEALYQMKKRRADGLRPLDPAAQPAVRVLLTD
jgi:diguanylate cyclase (GGDEF)-like protein